jgi:hypothetical protein
LKQSEPDATLCNIGLLRGSKGWTAIAKFLGTSPACAQTWAKLWKLLESQRIVILASHSIYDQVLNPETCGGEGCGKLAQGVSAKAVL